MNTSSAEREKEEKNLSVRNVVGSLSMPRTEETVTCN